MRTLDLKGERFGRWSVHGLAPNRNGKRYWNCVCDCGAVKIIQTSVLRSGKSVSCGCYYRGSNRKDWKGCGELSGLRWAQIKSNARQRTIPVNLSPAEAWGVFESQRGRCALTGLHISVGSKPGADNTASLDRIDSSKGYELGNVQWVHKDVNIMKNRFDLSYFKRMCVLVAQRN